LSGADAAGKGADSLHSADDAALAAKRLAQEYQCITAVSGAVDLVRTLFPPHHASR
jgi:hydroxyethylthiazole kinase-like sugar kinase family protein